MKSGSADFAAGFFFGIEFFSHLKHQSECDPTDEHIYQDVVDIANILKNVTVSSDFKAVIEAVLEKADDIYQRIVVVSAACQAYGNEIKIVLNGLAAHIQASGYTTQLTFHTLSNVGPITEKAKTATNAVSTGDYFTAGLSFGDLLKFVAFWDYKQTTQ